jgi:hypothetical protein
MLVICHSRRELAFCAEACGKEDESNLRIWLFREGSDRMLFRRAAKCNAALHSALKQRTMFYASHSFQKTEHFLKLYIARNPPEGLFRCFPDLPFGASPQDSCTRNRR